MLDALDVTVGQAVGVFDGAAREVLVEELTFGEWNSFARSVKHCPQKALCSVGVIDALERNEEPAFVRAHAAKAHDVRRAADFTTQLGAR